MSDAQETGLQLITMPRPTTVKEYVYQLLREQLTLGNVAPNQRILEKELTEKLGVSRTPVREALGRLANDGLLVATLKGYRVPQFTRQDVIHLSEVRLLLEPPAARQAAANTGDTGLQEMRAAISEEVAAHAKPDVNAFLKAHTRFRSAWLSRVENPLILESMGKTIHSLQLLRRWTMSDSMVRKILIDAHRSLLQAIEKRDPDRAHKVQAESIRRFRDRLLRKMKA